MYAAPLFEPGFAVPQGFALPGVVVEPLGVRHVVIDYEAVVSSRHDLHARFRWPGDWPLATSFLDDLADLGWHEKEFRDGTSFAYTVVDPARTICFGCLYVTPSRANGRIEMVFWLRTDGKAPIAEADFAARLRAWIAEDWQGRVVLVG